MVDANVERYYEQVFNVPRHGMNFFEIPLANFNKPIFFNEIFVNEQLRSGLYNLKIESVDTRTKFIGAVHQ